MSRLCFPAAALLVALTVAAVAQDAPEKARIEALIRHVEGLADAKFVRNGSAYDAKSAAKFLRGKWRNQEAKIKTAEDFIREVGTASSTTGRPYLIRHKDGTEEKSGEYLSAVLKKLEKK